MAEDLSYTSGTLGATAAEPTVTPKSPPGYELQDEIGRGGMGVVYRARDTGLDRDVAVKLLSERYAPDSVPAQRFLSEARITGQLQHPGIPAVHQVGTLADGRPFLAMKLIKGSTLETILKYRPEPSADGSPAAGGLAIFEAVCQAVGYAHAHRVIHRDLKPANVMVGAFGEVQVMDWGLAKVLGEGSPGTADALSADETQAWTQVSPALASGSHTQAGSLVGTPAFIPPEQALGEIEKVNERSDVFGLGAILAVILTGKAPYVGESFESVRVQAVRGKLEDCFARLDACGAEPELVSLCKQCLAFEPADRPADAGAVAAAVAGLRAAADERARHAELERVQAEGETREALARAAEQRRRRRILLTASGIIALLFLVGFAGVSWQWRVAETARDDEKSQRDRAEQALKIVESEEEAGRKLQYTTDMQLAPFLWKDDRTTAEQLRVLLARHIPDSNAAAPNPDLRGFEWHYYHHLLENSAAVFSGHGVSVVAGTFTSNGQLVTLDANGQVRSWVLGSQVEDEASRRNLPGGPSAQVRVLSPDGRLAALAEGNKIHVFDTSLGQETLQIDSADDPFCRLIFSADSARLVIVDDKIRWLSAVNGEVIATVNQQVSRETRGRSPRSLALSADGLTLAVVGHGRFHDTQFSIFRLDETAKKVTPLAKDAGFNGSLAGSALSPDGQRIALGHIFSGGLHVFDTTTGRPIAGHMSAHASSISAIAFSSDGAKLATGDSEGMIKIWQDARKLSSKSAALMTLKGHQGAITAVRFSIDGKRLVTTSVDKTARVWDLENAGVAIRQLEGTSKDWSFLARFSSDGHWIAAAGGNRVRLWDTATGRLVRELSAGANSSIFSVAFSPTDNRLLAVGYGGQADVSYVALWDIDAGAELVRLPGATDLPGFPASADSRVVGALAFSPDGKYLVAGFGVKWTLTPGGPPRPLKVWEVANRRQILLNGHTGFCMSLDFSRDGKLLASGSRDGTAILWSTATWKRVQTLQNPDNESLSGQSGRGMVEGVAFSPDGKTLAMAGREGNVHLWDVASGKLLETLKGHSSAVNAVVFSPDGRTLASGSTDHTVRLWNVQTRRQLMQLDPGNIELGDVGVLTLAFSPDGMHLLAGRVGGSFFWSAAPIVWNDPDRAAEKLRLLLQSNADFQSRIRMLSEHARLYEALEKLEKLAPNDVRVQIELAVARARRLAAQGNAALADAARTKARLLLEQKLAQEPEIPTWAVELADLLLIDNPARWTILKPVEAKSEPGATLSILPDDSILASGTNPLKDRYRVVLTVANDIDLTAIRLEALTYPSLPGNGPGRNSVGSFAQTSWNVTATSRDRKEPIRLPFDNACADHQHVDYPIRADGYWNIYGGHGANCTAVWSMSKPVSLAAGTTLTFQMQFQEGNGAGENLGRFRLSVSGNAAAFTRFAAMQITDPWAKRAAAYHVIGDEPALDTLLKHHPEAAAGVGDVYAAAGDWERAIAEYRQAITDQPAGSLSTKLATAYQSAGRTREGVAYLAKASAANPNDTLLSLKVAALQAWFRQEKELADTLQRVRAFAKDTNDAGTAERAAKVCSIRPSTDKAELSASLALARRGVELDHGSEWRNWRLLALGMAEYRSGNYAAADEALRAAAKAGPNNAMATGIAAFYRAMSLFRQGKPDEARQLAIATAAKMKALPKDEQNPPASDAYWDDLILWLAYKEAKSMIHFGKDVPGQQNP
ncbi:MAG: protein kinase domain-containing protein [Isosphaeraceae bacterium]